MSLLRRTSAPVVAVLGTIGVFVSTGAAVAATTAEVAVRDYEYVPPTVEIEVGDTVRWTWQSEDRHTVTSPGVFDSHPDCTVLTPEACGANGTVFRWTSSEPATIEYGCRLHPDRMRGTIHVVAAGAEPAPSEPLPPASPSPSPSSSPSPSAAPAAPSPTASPRPSSEPAPASPAPGPTRRSAPSLGFGQGSEVPSSPRPTAGAPQAPPPLVSDGSSEPLEPFPAAPSPTSEQDDVAGEVAVGPPGGSGRDAVRLAGAAAVAVSLLAFGRVVLFGRPWE